MVARHGLPGRKRPTLERRLGIARTNAAGFDGGTGSIPRARSRTTWRGRTRARDRARAPSTQREPATSALTSNARHDGGRRAHEPLVVRCGVGEVACVAVYRRATSAWKAVNALEERCHEGVTRAPGLGKPPRDLVSDADDLAEWNSLVETSGAMGTPSKSRGNLFCRPPELRPRERGLANQRRGCRPSPELARLRTRASTGHRAVSEASAGSVAV